MVTVVLVGSENSGNIGAIARSMKNFGLSDLVLVAPIVDHLNEEALSRSKHAREILESARLTESLVSLSEGYDLLVGTTSITGTDYNLPRTPVLPGQLKGLVCGKKTALVFGRDGSGLNNSEIKLCDIVVSIPSSQEYPALNISHAAAILFYELFSMKDTPASPQATKKEIEVIGKRIDAILSKMEFSTPEKLETQRIVWKRIMSKSSMTRREAFAVIGLLKKLEGSL